MIYKILGTAVSLLALLGQGSDAVPTTKRICLHGVNYNTRLGPDWAPPAQKCKSIDTVRADLVRLKALTQRIRIYSLIDCNQGEMVAKLATELKLKLYVGLWVDKAKTFDAEFGALESLLKKKLLTKDNVAGFLVGSETLYRKEIGPVAAVNNKIRVKNLLITNGMNMPVSIADVGDSIVRYQTTIVPKLDFLAFNAFPMWEKKPVANAVDYFIQKSQPLVNYAISQKKPFIVSETGWASGGHNPNTSVTNPQNQAIYFRDAWCKLAVARGYQYLFFGGYDADYRRTLDGKKDDVEGYFGIFNSAGVLKPELAKLKFACPGNPNVLYSIVTTGQCTPADEVKTPSNQALVTPGAPTATPAPGATPGATAGNASAAGVAPAATPVAGAPATSAPATSAAAAGGASSNETPAGESKTNVAKDAQASKDYKPKDKKTTTESVNNQASNAGSSTAAPSAFLLLISLLAFGWRLN